MKKIVSLCCFLCFFLFYSTVHSEDEVTAVIDNDTVVVDVPYLELTSGDSLLGLSAQFTASIGSTDVCFQLSKLEVLPAPKLRLVALETNFGTIKLELDSGKAPLSTENFINYVEDGFYNNTIFHRVISGFMIQGGLFRSDFTYDQPNEAIYNEANNGLTNVRGSIGMARTAEPHSAKSQFYINVVDNTFLDFPGTDNWGYTVFGKVVEGMDVVDEIKDLPTGAGGPFTSDVPEIEVVILDAYLIR